VQTPCDVPLPWIYRHHYYFPSFYMSPHIGYLSYSLSMCTEMGRDPCRCHRLASRGTTFQISYSQASKSHHQLSRVIPITRRNLRTLLTERGRSPSCRAAIWEKLEIPFSLWNCLVIGIFVSSNPGLECKDRLVISCMSSTAVLRFLQR
jgi:hypothetical protein